MANEFVVKNGIKIPTETASTVPYLDANKKLVSSDVTPTELDYLDGVTSNIQTQLDAKASASSVTDHLNDTTDAHDASAISSVAAGNLAATNVQTALDELQSDIDTRALATDLTNHTGDTTDAHDASAISSVASGNLAATDVQSALDELQTDIDGRQARSTLTTKGDLYVATASATIARQGIGSDGQILTADSAQTNGLKWATPASAPSSSFQISNLTLATSVAASALTISVKTQGGSDPSAGDPVLVGMLASGLSSGGYNQRTITSALSITISSGSTLGQKSAKSSRLFVYLIDNVGTLELAVSSHVHDTYSYKSTSTTAEGGAGAADSAYTLYSTTARTNVPYRLIGYIDNTQTTAGTWASAGTVINVGYDAILANQSVCALYTGAPPTGTLTSAYNTTTFGTKRTDTHNAYSSGSYTVPVSGAYSIAAQARHDATYAAGNTGGIGIFIDGVQYETGLVNAGGAQGSMWPAVSVHGVPLTAGQVVAIACYNNGTTPVFVNNSNQNYFSIVRTGTYYT